MLQPLDILCWRVTPEAPLFGRMIGWAERKMGEQRGDAAYYHVAFVSPMTSWMYASKPPMIDLYPIPNPLPTYVEVHRLRIPATPEQYHQIFSYAHSRKGRPYDFIGVLTAGMVELGGLEFCSLYVLNSFANGQIVLASNIEFPTPDDIAGSSLIARIA